MSRFGFVTAAVVYTVVTAALTWPLVLHLSSVVPNDLGDPLLNTYLVSWNARTLPLSERWWNLPQFYPIAGVTAFSEHLLGLSVLTTPVIKLGGSALLAHNLAFFLSFVFCGLAAHFLTYVVTGRHDAGFVAGIAFAFAPYRMTQFAHVQVLSSYWMPLALAGLHLFFRTRRTRWLLLFAGSWLLQALACGYYLFYLSTLVGLWLLWFAIGRERWVDLLRVLIAWGVAVLAMVPIALGYLRFQGAYGLRRWPDEIESFSADIASVLRAPYNLRLWGWLSVVDRPESEIFPGLMLVIVIVAGLALGWQHAAQTAPARLRVARRLLIAAAIVGAIAATPLIFGPWQIVIGGLKLLSVSAPQKPLSLAILLAIVALALHPSIRTAWSRRSPLAFYAIAAVCMWIFALGPSPTLMNKPLIYKAPYAWLMLVPGVDGVRVPARFWMLATLCLGVAAAIAIVRLRTRWPRLGPALPAVVCAVMLIEAWPQPLRLHQPPDERPSLARGAVRLELPVNPPHDPIVLYRAIEHGRPVLNGYSGYFAPHYWALQYMFDRQKPEVIDRIAALAPIEIVVDHARDGDGAQRRFVASHPLVKEVRREGAYTVYAVERVPGTRLPAVDGQAVPIASIAASLYQDRTPLMTDNDRVTRWHTGGPQAPDNEMTVDIGSVRDVRGVVMAIGGYVADFPRDLAIETSLDGAAWEPAWTGGTAVIAFSAALEDPLNVRLPFPFAPRQARYVRLRQVGTEGTYYWSIAELQIFGR